MTLDELKQKIPKRTLAEVFELHEKRQLVGPMFLKNSDYHAAPGLSKSALDLIEESPKFYQYRLKNPEDLKEALIFGSGYHSVIMEDEPLDSLIYVTKTQPKEPTLDELGRAPLSEKNVAKIKAMQAAFMRDRLAPKLLQNALIEVSFFWTDKDTGILCKCKPDIWLLEKLLLIDLKTCADTGKGPFKRAVKDCRYHVQGAFFIDGIAQSLRQAGIDVQGHEPTQFALAAQEKSEPFDIGFHQLGPRSLVTGEIQYRRNLETYAECVRTGNWPGKTGSKFVELELAPYDLEDWNERGL